MYPKLILPFSFPLLLHKIARSCKIAPRHSSSPLSLQTSTRMDAASASAEMSCVKMMTKSYLKALVSLHTFHSLLLTYSFPGVFSAGKTELSLAFLSCADYSCELCPPTWRQVHKKLQTRLRTHKATLGSQSKCLLHENTSARLIRWWLEGLRTFI